MDSKIPMAILTGYLGSGKTTLLNRVLNSEHNLRIAVLFNDVGSINIDSRVIAGIEDDTITLKDGSSCQTIRVNLVQSIARVIQTDNPPDYIIVESSGVTDTAQVLLAFNRSFLRNKVRIDSIIAIVDAEQFKILGEKPKRLIREQIRLSDIVILNKTDLVEQSTMQLMRQWVDNIIDKAKIYEAQYCNVPIDAILDTASYNPQTAFDTSSHGVHAHDIEEFHNHEHSDKSLVFATWTWESKEAVSLNEIRHILNNLPSRIFRAKGIIYMRDIPDKQIILQLVNKQVELTEGKPWAGIPKNSIVLIGDIGSIDKTILKTQFEKSVTGSMPQYKPDRFVDGAMKWLRTE